MKKENLKQVWRVRYAGNEPAVFVVVKNLSELESKVAPGIRSVTLNYPNVICEEGEDMSKMVMYSMGYSLFVKNPRGEGESPTHSLAATVVAKDLPDACKKLEDHCKNTQDGFLRTEVLTASRLNNQNIIF